MKMKPMKMKPTERLVRRTDLKGKRKLSGPEEENDENQAEEEENDEEIYYDAPETFVEPDDKNQPEEEKRRE